MIKKMISIVVPCYNEGKNLGNVHARVSAVMARLPAYDYELLFIDNASTDSSMQVYHELAATDRRVKAIVMSRNFGSNQSSILAGLKYAQGEAIMILDGDLQDPPELIPQFCEQWEKGFFVVYGVRTKRKGSLLRRIGYKCFYRLFRWLSYLDIPLDAGDFCLLDCKVAQIIVQLPERDLYMRGLRTWVGFAQTGVPYVRDDRHKGISSNSFFANFSWVKKAIVNFSYKPLEFISRLAIGAAMGMVVAAFVYMYLYFQHGAPRGFITLLMVMFMFGTIQLLALSVIGEYLIRIFHEVKGRPPYIVGHMIGDVRSERQVPIPHIVPPVMHQERML